jgi:hypothetical protein
MLTEAIRNADLNNYRDFERITAINQTGDDYEVYSVVKDKKGTSRSELTNIRSKSNNIIKGYSESDVKHKKQSNNSKNIKSTNIENLGFTKDFLDFETKSPALLMSHKNDDMEVSRRYENVDFSKLEDVDFNTNRNDIKAIANLNGRNQNNLNTISEVNEKDYETPKYPNLEVLHPNMRKKEGQDPKEESILDL